jgi:hypothetical protein
MDNLARLLVRQLDRGRELDLEPALLGRDQAIELGCDLLDLTDAAFLRREPQEVTDELVGVGGQLLQQLGLRARIELRVAQNRPKLGNPADCSREVAEVRVDLLQAPILLGSVEQRLRVRAMDDRYRSAPVGAAIIGPAPSRGRRSRGP